MERKRKHATQSQDKEISKRSRKSEEDDDILSVSQSTNGRAGRILRIYLRNFMCHSSLEIQLDPNTNYIIGRNGSGKSAILTALVVGLGGKARLTNRGTNMKAFIKVGQQSAAVEITLSNTGPMAFNPKIFGKEIIVVRTFNDTGGNSYKLKSSDGHVISSSFREVNRLIDALNIQVDNPVCILNQDVARTFLNSNDPTKKYIMFMKATNLESVKLQYKTALSNKKQAETILQTKLNNLKKLEREVKKMLEKYNAFENMTAIESKKNNLEIEAVWAQINAIEHELEQKQQTVDEINKQLENYTDLVKNKDERKQTLTNNLQQIKQQLLEIRNEEEGNQSLMNTKRNELQKLRETMVGKKNEITSIENIIKRKTVDRKNIEDEIGNSSDYHSNRLKIIEERDQKMLAAEEKSNKIINLLQTAENDLSHIRNTLKLKQQEQNNLTTELHEITTKVKARQSKIRSLKVDENNSYSVFGSTMQKITQSINAHKEQFLIMPKGPIGSYLKLKDKKWALAVEDFISTGILMSFCVDNQKDAKILGRIFSDVCGNSAKPTIISSKFIYQIHNYSPNKVAAPNNCIAMIDAIICKDPVIINCLIDQLSIENVLLISSNELARNVMSNASRVPKNCNRAVTLTGDQFYPDPNYRSYSCRSKNARYLQVSASEVIRIYEEELKTYGENETVVKKQLQVVTEDVTKLSREVQNLQKKISTLETGQHRIQTEINDLKLQLVPPEPNIAVLTEEMKEISKIIETKEKNLQKVTEEIETIKNEMKEAENGYTQLKNTSKSLETRMRPLLEEMDDAETKLKQINVNAKFNSDKIKQNKDKLILAQKEHERKNNILQEKIESANALGPRMETNRLLNIVLQELQEIDQQLKDTKASMGDKLTVSEAYMRMQEKYDKTKQEVDNIQECLAQMIETIESRARHYQKLAEYIGVRVREMFIAVLKLRQFKGTIEIDHEKQSLNLVVIPQQGSSKGSGLTHILSGGERSYSTVAFLHALWQVMEYPFYFLDEFDVFMDKVNRRTVMDILLEHAKEHADLQFVFLTPQDISSVVGDKNITVHRMADPDRKGGHQ